MKIELNRKYKNCKLGTRVYCIGKLYVDGIYVCDTIEDKDWGWTSETPSMEIAKVKAGNKSLTAIPQGTYDVTLNIQSPKFSNQKKYPFYWKLCKGFLPRLLDVKGFEGILIHCGNTERSSAGCIIVGYNTIKGQVTDSKKALESLYKLMNVAKAHGEKITIIIK